VIPVAPAVVAHRVASPLRALRDRPAPSLGEALDRWDSGALVRCAQVVQYDPDTFVVLVRPGLWSAEAVVLWPTDRDYASAFRLAVVVNRLYHHR
jgi:hypothetical protein